MRNVMSETEVDLTSEHGIDQESSGSISGKITGPLDHLEGNRCSASYQVFNFG